MKNLILLMLLLPLFATGQVVFEATLSSGTGDYTGGDDVRLSNQQSSVKPEAHLSLANG